MELQKKQKMISWLIRLKENQIKKEQELLSKEKTAIKKDSKEKTPEIVKILENDVGIF